MVRLVLRSACGCNPRKGKDLKSIKKFISKALRRSKNLGLLGRDRVFAKYLFVPDSSA